MDKRFFAPSTRKKRYNIVKLSQETKVQRLIGAFFFGDSPKRKKKFKKEKKLTSNHCERNIREKYD